MTAIQAVFVRGHEERSEPKPHTVFRIEVEASVRSWQVWRRYSEFDDLHDELSKLTGREPPVALPPKHVLHALTLRRTLHDEKLLEERRSGLEAYLRAIMSSRESMWRDSHVFKEFLGVPTDKRVGILAGGTSPQFTISSWLDEHADLQALARDVRADINKRNSLVDMGDVGASHSSNVQAKKKLVNLLDRVGSLAKELESLGLRGMMAEGELHRRSDMVARLQDDCERLAKMVSATRHLTRAVDDRGNAPHSDRTALLSPTSGAGFDRPVTRVFGKPPQETEVTRPLENEGLFQLQKNQMEEQDAQLSLLTAVLRRQRQLGIAISEEIEQQNEMLDQLSEDVDRFGVKLNAAGKQLRRLE